MGDFIALCNRVNELQDNRSVIFWCRTHHVGGRVWVLTTDIRTVSPFPISRATLLPMLTTLKLPLSDTALRTGRAVVGQCGSLISKVLYVKQEPRRNSPSSRCRCATDQDSSYFYSGLPQDGKHYFGRPRRGI